MVSTSVKLQIKNKQNETYKGEIVSLEKKIKILKQQHNIKKLANNSQEGF